MFDERNIDIDETVEARKQKIAGNDAWNLLADAAEIVVGRGKKYQVISPSEENREEILRLCLGRTGNLRAPTLRIGDRLLVGFNEAMYSEYL
ncbi:MAG TPA: hypothetical protein ENK27_12115 [Desulfobulbus sp.]|nr:hypothetical protein [Desulfobulbus sp.]